MKINKPLIRKMIKHYEDVPESFDQNDYGHKHYEEDRPKPVCGTVACLAGTAVICSTQTLQGGVRKLFRILKTDGADIDEIAGSLMGVPYDEASNLFLGGAWGWPEKYAGQFENAKNYKGEARAAINLLKAILKTDGKILES